MNIQNAITALGLLGIGGLITMFFRIRWERKNEVLSHKQEFMETRYKCVIQLMYSALDFDSRNLLLRQYSRNFNNIDELIDELKAEWNHMILYASDEVLISVKQFIQNPTIEHYGQCASAMRKNLWGEKVSKEILVRDIVELNTL